jgi:hypothetical protein
MARARAFPLLCAALCANAFAQPAGQGVISGTVVEASGSAPVRKAIVTLTWQGTPRSWATERTDGSGRFVFEGLPPGKYDLRANKPGLGVAIYGADSVRELGDLITLGDGEGRRDLKLAFLRSATIAGRVMDHDGDPLPGVNVSLLRTGRNLGERILVNYRNASTDDRGEYKISNIDPGQYYLISRPNMQRQIGRTQQEMPVPQYYGGARDPKDAAAIHVRGGEVLTGIDFNLSTTHPARITGRITGVPDIDPAAQEPRPSRHGGGIAMFDDRDVQVVLHPADDSQQYWGEGAGARGPDYRFELGDQMPGRYRVQATVRSKDKTYYESQVVDAQEGLNDLVLVMTPAVRVKGHLKVEGPAANPVESFTVALAQPGEAPGGRAHSSRVAKDGTFTFDEVPPGDWTLNITPNTGGLFDKSVHLGDKDFLYKRIELPPGSDAPLEVVISSNTAVVQGQIDGGDAAGKRVGILIEPVGKLHTLARFYYSGIADDSGNFKVRGVAPGKYKIIALEKIATENFRNPESGDLLDGFGEELEVTEGATVEALPKLVPEEKARELLKP